MEFKRGIWSLLKSLLVAVAAPVALFFVVSIFTEKSWLLYGIPSIAFVFLVYCAIFSENIRFIIEGNRLEYYKRSKLETYDLNLYDVGYRAKTTDGDPDHIYLYLTKKGEEDSISIDCTPLGLSKFYKMYELLETSSEKKVHKVQTKKKGDK